MIQRIIHQIWCGTQPMPDRENKWCQQMQKTNSEWEYRLWGNEALESYGRDPYIKTLLAQGEKWAFISDRLRILILRDHGGVYLDTDCQPVRPLNILPLWDWPHLDFVYGTRDPLREGVSLWRGVAFADNTFLASKKDGRLVGRLLDLWKPESPVVTGHRLGVQLLREQRPHDTVQLPFPYFYDMKSGPETICLHDCHNAGSWVDHKRPVVTVPAGTHLVANAKV